LSVLFLLYSRIMCSRLLIVPAEFVKTLKNRSGWC